MKHSGLLLLALAISLAECVCAFPTRAQDAPVDGFAARLYSSKAGDTMPYRVFIPAHYDPKQFYPLILWLHGAEGRGDDNLQQISGGNTLGSHIWTTAENQAKFPAFVLAPQCPERKWWGRPHESGPPPVLRLALEILAAVRQEFSIDPARIYVSGQSMGGEGTWAAILFAPHTFAAAVPLCGYLEPEKMRRLPRIPVWAFQGGADALVSVGLAHEALAAFRAGGGTAKYNEYPGIGHEVWDKAFAEADLVPWLFLQSRTPTHK